MAGLRPPYTLSLPIRGTSTVLESALENVTSVSSPESDSIGEMETICESEGGGIMSGGRGKEGVRGVTGSFFGVSMSLVGLTEVSAWLFFRRYQMNSARRVSKMPTTTPATIPPIVPPLDLQRECWVRYQ